MDKFFKILYDIIDEFIPYIVGGAIGAIIHRMRTEMPNITFLKSIVMSIFISFVIGVACKDYFIIKNDHIIFSVCGLSGLFSKIILDEFEQLLKLAFNYAKNKIKKTK